MFHVKHCHCRPSTGSGRTWEFVEPLTTGFVLSLSKDGHPLIPPQAFDMGAARP